MPQLRLTLPPAASARPFPLVVALHSLSNNGHEPQSEWGLDELAARNGFAVAYPDAVDGSWNAGTCCGQAAAQHVDDVGWLRALISHLEQHYPIDRRRVIMIGFSNGGMLAYRYACEHAPEIAGIAVVAASLQVATCAPAAPVTVVAIHGQLDERVPYEGTAWSDGLGTALTSVERSLAPFRASDGCPVPSLKGDSILTESDGLPVVKGTDGSLNGVGGDGTADRSEGTTGGKASTAPSTTTGIGTHAASRRETVCTSGKRVVEFLLPDLAHGWPPVTGSASFHTAEVAWRLLAPMRSSAAEPDI